MKTFAIMSQKGGAGKTTLALNLAVQSHLSHKRTIIIDLDPQASISTWGDRRATEPMVTASFSTRLKNVLEIAKQNEIEHVFLDTPPHAQRDAQIAVELADVMIIPCRPNIFDLQAIGDTISLAQALSKKPFIVFNAVAPQSAILREALEALKTKYDQKILICPDFIAQRIAYVHSSTNGQGVQEYEPKGKAAVEIKNVYEFICG